MHWFQHSSMTHSVIRGQQIDSMLSQVKQSVDTLAALATQSLTDLKAFQTSEVYVTNYPKSLESIALESAKNTNGALTYYIRYNPEFTNPTSGIFATRDSDESEFEQLTPTDFSIYDPSDLEHVGWYYIPVQHLSSMQTIRLCTTKIWNSEPI